MLCEGWKETERERERERARGREGGKTMKSIVIYIWYDV